MIARTVEGTMHPREMAAVAPEVARERNRAQLMGAANLARWAAHWATKAGDLTRAAEEMARAARLELMIAQLGT